MWEEKVAALLQRAAARLHLTHTVTQNSPTHTHSHTHAHTHAHTGKVTRPAFMHRHRQQRDTRTFYTQTHTVKHDRHLDLVFVVSRKVSVLKRGGARGAVSWAVKAVALSGCLRS